MGLYLPPRVKTAGDVHWEPILTAAGKGDTDPTEEPYTTDDWDPGGAGGVDFGTFGFGRSVIRLSTFGAGPYDEGDATQRAALINLSTPYDFTGKFAVVSMAVEDWDAFASSGVYFRILLYNGSDYFKWEIEEIGGTYEILLDELNDGARKVMQTLTLSFADAVESGTPDRSAIDSVRVQVDDGGGPGGVKAYFGGLWSADNRADAWVAPMFDDGHVSIYERGFPILRKYGIPATCYVIIDRFGNDNYLTVDMCREMAAEGWSFELHAYGDGTTAPNTNTFNDTLSQTQRLESYQKGLQWLVDQGLNPAGHYAYPNGGFSQATEDDVKRFFATARTTVQGGYETGYPANAHRLRVGPTYHNSSDTPAQILQAVDDGYPEGCWMGLLFHRVTADGEDSESTEIDETDLETIISGVKTRRDAGNIKVGPVHASLEYIGS